MNRPEYWQDDETWAVEKARSVDIEENIRFLNEMSALICGRARSGSDSLGVPRPQPQAPKETNQAE